MKSIPARLTWLASWAVILMGMLVLVGWQFNLELLKRVHPGFVAMNPVTATCFLLAGVSLWLSTGPDDERQQFWARVLAGMVFTAALLNLPDFAVALRPRRLRRTTGTG